MSAPSTDRPVFPHGYGLPTTTEGMLGWAEVEAELVGAQVYWLASVRPDGRPHVVPRWGVWHAGRFYYDGSPQTRHTRNVEGNPAVSLNLENGMRVVIVEGESQATHADPAGLGAELAAAYAKYHSPGYAPTADSWTTEEDGLRVITPHRVLAWFDFPKDSTRFTFG